MRETEPCDDTNAENAVSIVQNEVRQVIALVHQTKINEASPRFLFASQNRNERKNINRDDDSQYFI